ncbi:hypothetical protein PR202_gb16808 [Eleusine coracana subsp. coracana]|uniref:Dirigent protein n=1 Tax=Eleusine coracana subsp. coracana TaxID=191504 RepID=A0AAV5F1W2_ELECO|nr:hypothetical protein QOZ80_9BG0694230 [Eleusine coracana subsp. coracana]GJN28606.1 hypothetical protein PR202_gb16750 [Eleusine coracana subsp. coracana]GJN28658.1 hypothetical protein PR202_gb16808 [Eleusine coracana subsp. coracana]
MAFSSHALSLFLVLLVAWSSSPTVLAAGNQGLGLVHIHLYMHETSVGPNATFARILASPLGANSSFGVTGVVDNELRAGPDRASSELVGRFQGLIVGAGLQPGMGYFTSVTLVFTAGEYSGSTLSIQGSVPSFAVTFERTVVGGTGAFRFVRGYSLTKMLPNPTAETSVFQIDVFLLMHSANI